MAKQSKEVLESLSRLNDQYLLAKEKGDTVKAKLIKKVIERVKNKNE